MPVHRKKALTKAQIAALAAYEPHLSAASRTACLKNTQQPQSNFDWYYKGWEEDLNIASINEIDLTPYIVGKNKSKRIKGVIHDPTTGEDYVSKKPAWTLNLWCPYRGLYIGDCTVRAKIRVVEKGKLYLEEPLAISSPYSWRDKQLDLHILRDVYLHILRDGKAVYFKAIGRIEPGETYIVPEGMLCDLWPL